MDSHIIHLSSDYIFSIIHEIEKKVPVKDWVINGVHVWPILRLQLRPIIFEMTRNKAVEQAHLNSKDIPLASRSFSKILQFFKGFYKFPFRRILKQHDAVLFSDGCSLDCIDGIWSDKFFRLIEDQLNELGHTALTIAPFEVSLKPLKSPLYNISIIETGAEILTSLRIRLPFERIRLKQYDTFIEILSHHNIPIRYFTYKEIFFKSYKISLIEKVFTWILKHIKPSVAMIVSYYHDLGFAFNRACKKLGIPTVEIQHGTQGGVHDAYNHWQQVPAHGYPELPSLFWAWSQEDALEIERWGSKTHGAHRAFVGGNPTVEFWLCKNKTVQGYDNKIDSLKKKISTNENVIDILVTLQPVQAFQAYWDILAQVIQHDFGNIQWWIRNHPTTTFGNKTEGLDKILSLKNDHVEIYESSRLPLGALLRNMDLHVTVRSSTCLEAKSFGLKTLFIADFVQSEHSEFIKNGHGIIIEDKQSIIQYIKDFTPDKKAQDYMESSRSVGILLEKIKNL